MHFLVLRRYQKALSIAWSFLEGARQLGQYMTTCMHCDKVYYTYIPRRSDPELTAATRLLMDSVPHFFSISQIIRQ